MARTATTQEAQRMVLGVHARGEWDSPMYCMVEMDVERARELLKLMEHVRALHKEDASIYSLCMWDCPGEYNDDGDPEASSSDDPFWRMDAEQAVITDDGVYWTAYVKGTGYELETDTLGRKELQEMAKPRGGRKEAERGR